MIEHEELELPEKAVPIIGEAVAIVTDAFCLACNTKLEFRRKRPKPSQFDGSAKYNRRSWSARHVKHGWPSSRQGPCPWTRQTRRWSFTNP